MTNVAGNLGTLVMGLVEGVFRVPGVGGVLFAAIGEQDRSQVVGVVTCVAVAIIVANTLADLLVALLDPRVRLG